MLVGEDDPKGLGDLLDVSATTNIEEVGRLAAMVFHEIHRAHRQAGAVDEAADRAVEFDIGETGGRSPRFGRLFFRFIAQGGEILVAEQGVVVERHLGVEGHHPAIFGQHQRIDFQERGIEGHEGLGERPEKLLCGPPARVGQAELR